MSLPVSHYEALLAEVRGLRRKAQRVQQLATPLITNCSSNFIHQIPPLHQNDEVRFRSFKMESVLLAGREHNASTMNTDGAATSSAEGDTTCSEDEYGHISPMRTTLSVSSEPTPKTDQLTSLYHGTWPVERTMWNSEPLHHQTSPPIQQMDVASVMSFASSSGGLHLASLSRRSSQQLEAKVDMVYSLLAMLSDQENADMGETLLALSTNPESCLAMRQSGCIPLLVQMVQSDREPDARKKAALALHNLVHSQPDEKLRKREVRIFKLLEQTREYTEAVRNHREYELDIEDGNDRHPVQTVAHLMKLSFDELHRQAICTLGGIFIIAMLVEVEHVHHGSITMEQHCILMRRYACMVLTNLTFGDSGNKALLCSFKDFMKALVVQLQSPSDELRQVTASVLRNLSWRADSSSKEILREVASVTGLMKSAMFDNKENTLKSMLSALWNLSAHCTENKSEICSVDGALGFLVDMLTFKTPSKSLAIIENSGGILRNISSQIAVREDYREILREHNCLEILLDQLKSPSLTIVSNACGTLWNLSAKCGKDQEALWQMGAPSMLRSLNHSKHKMIAMGSSAALKNLLSANPSQTVVPLMDATALAMDLPILPTLGVRKQKALLQDLDQSLSETYENIEKDSPIKTQHFIEKNQDLNEPSTSYKSFLKKPKNIDEDNGFNVYFDSGLPTLDVDGSSSSSFDNEKCRKRDCNFKLKEVSACSDEKDNCSIEDVSDSDNQSSLGLLEYRLTHDSFSCNNSDELVGRKEMEFSSVQTTPNLPNSKTPNITMFNGDINEIDMDDISIHYTPELEHKCDDGEEFNEKQDFEKEKRPTKPQISNIPLPCTNFHQVPEDTITPTKKLRRPISGLPRRSLPSSTPNPSNTRRGDSLNETYKTSSIDTNEKYSLPSTTTTKELLSLTDINCSLPILDESTQNKEDAILNISRESNTSPGVMENGPLLTRDLLEHSCDENISVDNRMLDPDAMIESLDRFTAELVSQASHLQGNTWNDDTSPNEITFSSITAPNIITFDDSEIVDEKLEGEQPAESNDFSSLNTTTMTASTLIAIEATKLASVFKTNAEMSTSLNSSVASLELDKVPPPLLHNSLPNSPKPIPRKRSLPKCIVLRRALSNSHNGSSLESLDNHSLTGLDQVNPPSLMGDLLDMEESVTSVASWPNEGNKIDFNINYDMNSITDLETINPPSIFNEITDLCNSLADVCTDAIGGSETEMFEDCQSRMLQTDDDVTEFSDANSVTPLHSDVSSCETSPKKNKPPSKVMSLKQRRSIDRNRYKTYTVPPALALEASISDDFKSALDRPQTGSKLTLKEKRQQDPSRFETRIIEKCEIVPNASRTKLSIRRNFLQKRIENKERFKTQILNESSELDLMVQREANFVLKSLDEVKSGDDLLECETLSLVSNDNDDSERNSSPINYRTYHKSWGLKKNVPVIGGSCNSPVESRPVINESTSAASSSKPKITKPNEDTTTITAAPIKPIRGRRKPLYSKTPKPPQQSTSKNPLKSGVKAAPSKKPPPERQNTFTKNEAPKSRIPMTSSRIPAAKIRPISSASSDRAIKPPVRAVCYGRSTSADNTRKVPNQAAVSSQSAGKKPGGSTTTTKKQVTSKIASLWKRIEESKSKQQQAPLKKDTRVWIGGEAQDGADAN